VTFHGEGKMPSPWLFWRMLAEEGYRSLLIVRDPRDVAVSFVHCR